MSSNTQKILEELYHLNPLLREKQESIRKLIEKMQKNRPEVEISDQFRSELKSKILSDMGHIPLWREGKSSNWKVAFSVFTTACLCFILTIGMWNVIF